MRRASSTFLLVGTSSSTKRLYCIDTGRALPQVYHRDQLIVKVKWSEDTKTSCFNEHFGSPLSTCSYGITHTHADICFTVALGGVLAGCYMFHTDLDYTNIVLPKRIYGRYIFLVASHILLISFHTFSTTLPHLIAARPFATSSHTALSAMADNLFFGMFLTSYRHFNFLTSLIVFKVGTFPVLLLILPCYSSYSSILQQQYCESCRHVFCFQLFYQLRVPFS